ncbi:MAG TPA: 2-amino-4-hydroxy-6-hydroxymethyldihydropteridine diphosphokinase [Spirochaetota bacterium]|nr:2-amino-4-hydroxy-6-hydroxymethyldihydropteridine diphosphokinase [Spirochaetota bacterium]
MVNDLFLSIGSNIEPRLEYLKLSKNELDKKFDFICSSSIYETQPLLDEDQNNFYNQVLFYKTNIDDAYLILNIVKDIEKQIGRIKDVNRPKGPRIIDIDIIVFGNKSITSDLLTIPHKSFYERNFVLIPFKEIISNFKDIKKKYEIDDYIEKNSNQKVTKISI